MIDKDAELYTTKLLRQWKAKAEKLSIRKLKGATIAYKLAGKAKPKYQPHLDVDLIHTSRTRMNLGYSRKNPVFLLKTEGM